MTRMPRRAFLGATAGALASAPLLATARPSPNETLGIGVIGVGSRGTALLQNLLQIPNLAVRAICDTEPEHLERALKTVEKAGQKRPAGSTDGSSSRES